MNEGDERIKESEFNSNIQCIIRINTLMQTLHDCAMGIFQMQDGTYLNQRVCYCKTLLRLYKEGKYKFTNDEIKQCQEYKKKLNKYILINPTTRAQVNDNDVLLADEFEDLLIKCLDKHNMLMANKQEIDDSPSGEWTEDIE